MRFRCDQCQTKYNIPDDRIRGKRLNIRCKTCNNFIHVSEAGVVRDSEYQIPAYGPAFNPEEKTFWTAAELGLGGLMSLEPDPEPVALPAEPPVTAESPSLQPEQSKPRLAQEGDVLKDRYLLRSFIEKAPHGEIFNGPDLRTGSSVVIYIFARDILSSEVPNWFTDLIAVQHPALDGVVDQGITPKNSVFIVTLHSLGRTLFATRQQPRKSAEVSDAYNICRQIGYGLAAMHEQGLSQDFFDMNDILINQGLDLLDASSCRVRLVRSGVDSILRKTKTGSVAALAEISVGSLRRFPPEVILGEFGGSRGNSDQFLLASLFFELLMTHPPYEYQRERGSKFGISRDDLRSQSPAQLSPELHALQPVLNRALAIKHRERYDNILVFLDELKQACQTIRGFSEAGMPEVPRPQSFGIPKVVGPESTSSPPEEAPESELASAVTESPPIQVLSLDRLRTTTVAIATVGPGEGALPMTWAATVPISAARVRTLGACIGAFALAAPLLSFFAQCPAQTIPELRPELLILPQDNARNSANVRESGRIAMARTEITQGQFHAVLGFNPSHFRGTDTLPVDSIQYPEAASYCNRLSEIEGLSPCYKFAADKSVQSEISGCSGYRLPTANEWQYAALAAEHPSAGQALMAASGFAWLVDDSGGSTHPVATRNANAWGFYDLTGNVAELLSNIETIGGSWQDLRATGPLFRPSPYPQLSRDDRNGFRIVRSIP